MHSISLVVALLDGGFLLYSHRVTSDIDAKLVVCTQLTRDISQISILAFNATQQDDAVAHRQWLAKFDQLIAALRGKSVHWTETERGRLQRIAEIALFIRDNLEELKRPDRENLPDNASFLQSRIVIFSQAMMSDIRDLTNHVLNSGKQGRERSVQILVPLALSLALLFMVIVAWVAGSINRPLRRLMAVTRRLARGDLAARSTLKGRMN